MSSIHNLFDAGKQQLRMGLFSKAARSFRIVLQEAIDSGDIMMQAQALHRHAMTESSIDDARQQLQAAKEKLSTNQPIALAWIIRDHAELERKAGEHAVARELLEEAKRILQLVKTSDDARINLELDIVKGFVARIDIDKRLNVPRAIQSMKDVDARLQAARQAEADTIRFTGMKNVEELPLFKNKDFILEAELDNLLHLAPILPLFERELYVVRAARLAASLGKHFVALQCLALLGGKPLAGAYRVSGYMALKGVGFVLRRESIL